MNGNNPSKLFPIFSVTARQQLRVGYMDSHGNTVIHPRFSSGLEFREGLAPVLTGKKWHYIDGSGEQAFAGEFGTAERMSQGRAYATVRPRKYGYLDTEGRVVTEGAYRWASHFAEGRALVYRGSLAGYIDLNGNEIISLEYQAGSAFSEGLAAVRRAGRWGYVDAVGNVMIPFQFESAYASAFSNGLAAIPGMGSKTGFIDRTGKFAIKPTFDFGYGFTEDLAGVSLNGSWAYIDTTGNVAIKQRFKHTYPFSEGLAAVEVQSQSGEPVIGFIDRSGEFVIPPQFRLAIRFHDGICWTETKDTCAYINRDGETLWECPWVQTGLSLRL